MAKPNFKRPAARPSKRSVYVYTSDCCRVPATKTPLVAANNVIKPYLGAAPEAEGTLGKFRCGACKKRCTVTRSLNKKEEKNVQANSQEGPSNTDSQVGA
jgi:hypothetical protein